MAKKIRDHRYERMLETYEKLVTSGRLSVERYWNPKIQKLMPRFPEIRCKVRCNGRLHEIVRTETGQLALLDHKLSRENAMRELGGSECRCMEVLRVWSGHSADVYGEDVQPVRYFRGHARMPNKLLTAYHVRWSDREVREREKQERTDADPLSFKFFGYHVIRTEDTSQELLAGCGYDKMPHHSTNTYMCLRGGEKACQATGRVEYHGNFATTSWEVLVPMLWWHKVYKRGLAVIDGHFVCRVLTEEPLSVMAVRQMPHYRLAVSPAWVEQGKLRWQHQEAV